MPRGDETGPVRGGRRGFGKRDGSGPGSGRMGRGRARTGVSEECICPKCGAKVPKHAGRPCYQMRCPKCGSTLVRA